MNRFIRFDEDNISKLIVRYSLVLVTAIALVLAAIYTPKYYYEYMDNIRSTSAHLNRLYRERISFEVNEIVSNTGYRSQVHRHYMLKSSDAVDDEDLKKSVKEIVLQEITDINLKGSQEYIFIYELLKPEGGKDFAVMLVNPNRPDLVGKMIDEDYRDIEGFEFRKEFMRQIRETGEAFVSYVYKDPVTGKSDLKTSYFKLYPEFQWIFAQGFYKGQIDKIIAPDVLRYKKDFIFRVALILGLISTFLTMYYFLFKNFSQRVQETIVRYRSGLEEKNRMLEEEIERSNSKRQELSDYTDYISKIYESIPVGIVLIDAADRTIVKINDSGLETLGYEREEITGRTCNDAFCPALMGNCPIIDHGQDIDNTERIIVDKNGRNISVLKKACAVWVQGKEYLLESFIDITKIKEAEAELIRLKEKAEQASFEKSRFLANMSHEIRTPMNSIYGMSSILEETPLSKEQKEIVETIKASSEILVRILNDILDLSKIESGKITVERSDFDLRNFIRTVVNPFEMKLKNTDIDFSLRFMPEDISGVYKGDSLKLGQILNNLIGNAVKFTEKGCIEFCVERTYDSDFESTFTFSVSDTGIGINEDQLTKIFERFSQADISTTRKYGGTGLGLTISKRLAEILGGDLNVKSESGKGSRFYFSLNFERSGSGLPETHRATDMKDLSDKLKKINILVAEDNIFNQKYISTLLKKRSLNFRIVDNGEEVLDELTRNKYDIILMDGQMPVMDGISTTKLIRSSYSHYSTIPIIALTASALTDDKKKFIDAGMNDYISKPIDQNILFSAIARFCVPGLVADITDDETADPMSADERHRQQWKFIDINDFLTKAGSFGKQTFTDILKLLIKEIPQKIVKIESALRKNDRETLKFESHSLKGIVSNFEAPEFNKLCLDLDFYADSGTLSKAKETFEIIKRICPGYIYELNSFVEFLESEI